VQGDQTVTEWRGISKGNEIKVEGEGRSRFVFQPARMDGDQCLWITASYHRECSKSGTRMFTPNRVIDLSMVL
jgi:hypothetical protein